MLIMGTYQNALLFWGLKKSARIPNYTYMQGGRQDGVEPFFYSTDEIKSFSSTLKNLICELLLKYIFENPINNCDLCFP